MRRFQWLFLTFCLALMGCVGPLVRRGDTYAQLGQWVQAVEAYSRAYEVRPNAKLVVEKLDDAREHAVHQEVGRAVESLEAGSLKVAWRHAAQAARVHPNDERVKEIRKRIRDEATLRVRGFVKAQDWDQGFRVWRLLKRNDSGAAIVEVLSDEIAGAMIERAEDLQHDLRYWEARELLVELGKRQPAHAREMEIRVDELKGRWIIGMRNQSLADERAGLLASALIRAAVAAGLSRHRDDHERRQRLRGKFVRRHGVIIGTKISGEPRRVRRMISKLDHVLSWKQVVRWASGARKAEVGGRIVLSRPLMSDTFKLRTGEQSYVSGFEEVANPDHARKMQSISATASRLDQTNRMIGSLDGELSLYQGEISRLEAQHPNLLEGLEQTKTLLANASVELSRTKESLREAQEVEASIQRAKIKRQKLEADIARYEQTLAAMPNQDPPPDQSAVLEVEMALEQARADVATIVEPDSFELQLAGQMAQRKMEADLQAENVRVLQEEFAGRKAELTAVEAELGSSKAERSAVRQELNDLLEEYSQMYKDYVSLIVAFGHTPETVSQPIHDTFKYEIKDWTRACTVKANMSGVRPAQADMQQVLRSTSQMSDSSHSSHRQYDVEADYLRYPKSNLWLIDDADAKLQEHVRDWLRRALSTVRADRVARAQRSVGKDTNAAATDFLVAWMLSPRKHPAGFDTFIVKYYGKMDLTWLEVRGQ